MFTLQQLTEAHAKVKSGADFPQYVQDLKHLGVRAYDHYAADGHGEFFGAGQQLATAPTGTPLAIAAHSDGPALKHALAIHQQGQTDYPTFCRQAAGAGVVKWTTRTDELTCTYYDQQGQAVVVETVPMP